MHNEKGILWKSIFGDSGYPFNCHPVSLWYAYIQGKYSMKKRLSTKK